MYRTPAGTSLVLHRGVWKIPTQEKKIYLTFDDGPCDQTQGLLSLLEDHDAKATFFCLGKNATKYPGLMSTMKNNGHRLGNHGYDHVNGWENRNVESYLQNIIKAAPQTDNTLFRPPYGKTTLAQRKTILAKGYSIVMWSFNSKDYKASLNHQKVIEKAKKATRSGAIFLFHDSQKAKKNTIPILKKLLPYWKDQGWLMSPIEINDL